MRTRRAPCVLLALCALSVPEVARADAVDEAKSLMARGWAAYEKGDLATAITYYRTALSLVPVASGPERELARCYDEMGKPREAVEHYRAYLSKKPDAPDRADVEGRIAALVPTLPPPDPVKTPRGKLRVDASPPGASVVVDGRDVGRTPLPAALELEAGEHEVAVTLAGHEPWAARLAVRPDAETVALARLVRLPPVGVPDASRASPETAALAPPSGGKGTPADRAVGPAAPPPKSRRTAGIVAASALGAAATALGITIAVLFVRFGRYDLSAAVVTANGGM